MLDPADVAAVIIDYPADDCVREVGPLDEMDLLTLRQQGPEHSVRPLERVRAFHHQAAIWLAAGIRPVEICARLSISQSALSSLEKSPQFVELIEVYRKESKQQAFDIVPMMGIINQETLMEIHDRLVDPERRAILTTKGLLEIFKEVADRTGHAPIRRVEEKHRHEYGLDPETLQAIKRELAEDPLTSARDVTPSPFDGAAPSAESQSPPVGPVSILQSLAQTDHQRNESSGQDL